MTIRTVSIVGARPQFVKVAPVCRAISLANQRGTANIEDRLIHTGQHYDRGMSHVFFEELEIPPPSINLGVGSGSHAQQTAGMMTALEKLLAGDGRPDLLIVYGDTNSTLAGALVAAKLWIPVVHVEAGLRSFNRAMPEEINRIVTDRVSDLLLAPTETAMTNLRSEGLGAAADLVGDVMHDAVLFNRDRARARSDVMSRLNLGERGFALVTIHRAESTQADVLRRILDALAAVARRGIELVFPVHPRTVAVMSAELSDWRPPEGLRIIEPLGFLDNLRLIDAARLVITDSGGMQKEALFCGTPCVTLRDETEWVETVAAGGNVIAGRESARIVAAVEGVLDRVVDGVALRSAASRYFGAGDAAERIVRSITDFAYARRGGLAA